MSTGVDALLETEAVRSEPTGRDWVAIGFGLAAAFSVIALYVVGVWSVVVLVAALF